MARYIKRKTKITTAELRSRFLAKLGKNAYPIMDDFTHDFPPWIWPYIRSAYLAGKLTDKFTVPTGADINDYSLPVVGFLTQAKIEFPGKKLDALPKDFFPTLKETMATKLMDQYGKVVSPEDFGDIPPHLAPFATPCFRLGELARIKRFSALRNIFNG